MMSSYAVLLRGINVGGKNIVRMAALRKCLAELGYTNVSTYIASGNVILQSNMAAAAIQEQIETALVKNFTLDSEFVKVLALSLDQFQAVIDKKPKTFGEQPDKYHSDAIFLMGINAADALPAFSPRAGVDDVWPGDGVIYSQRLTAERTKSRLNKVMESPVYKYMTIRNWSTTIKLLDLLKSINANKGE